MILLRVKIKQFVVKEEENLQWYKYVIVIVKTKDK